MAGLGLQAVKLVVLEANLPAKYTVPHVALSVNYHLYAYCKDLSNMRHCSRTKVSMNRLLREKRSCLPKTGKQLNMVPH